MGKSGTRATKLSSLGLTPQRELFCQEYVKDFNGGRSAARAGYAAGSASAEASRLLNDVKVQARLKELIEKRNKRIEISQDKVVKELAAIAFHDAKKAATWTASKVTLKTSNEINDDTAHAIAEISDTDSGGVRIKFHGKERALELLGKHLGMWDKLNNPSQTNVQLIVNAPDAETAELISKVVASGSQRN